MIDFTLTDEQKAMQQMVHDFAEKEIRPRAEEYDESEEYPWDIVRKAAKLGLTNFGFPEEYGGGDVTDPITHFIVAEELGWGCAGIGTAILSSGLAATAIMVMGTEEQKKKYIGRFCDPDDVRLGAMCLTEPEAGSDVSNISTTAVLEGDEYVLNGNKCFITNGGIADIHVVFATTDKSLGWVFAHPIPLKLFLPTAGCQKQTVLVENQVNPVPPPELSGPWPCSSTRAPESEPLPSALPVPLSSMPCNTARKGFSSKSQLSFMKVLASN